MNWFAVISFWIFLFACGFLCGVARGRKSQPERVALVTGSDIANVAIEAADAWEAMVKSWNSVNVTSAESMRLGMVRDEKIDILRKLVRETRKAS